MECLSCQSRLDSPVVEGLATLLTLFRLLFRSQIQRFWWEDVWAAVMIVCGIAFITGQLFSFDAEKTGIRNVLTTYLTYRQLRGSADYWLDNLYWTIIIALKTFRCVGHMIPTLLLDGMYALPNAEVFFEITSG